MSFDFPKRNHARESNTDDVSFWMLSKGAEDSTLHLLQTVGVTNGREIGGGVLLLTVPSKFDSELEQVKDPALVRQPDFTRRSKFQEMKL